MKLPMTAALPVASKTMSAPSGARAKTASSRDWVAGLTQTMFSEKFLRTMSSFFSLTSASTTLEQPEASAARAVTMPMVPAPNTTATSPGWMPAVLAE